MFIIIASAVGGEKNLKGGYYAQPKLTLTIVNTMQKQFILRNPLLPRVLVFTVWIPRC